MGTKNPRFSRRRKDGDIAAGSIRLVVLLLVSLAVVLFVLETPQEGPQQQQQLQHDWRAMSGGSSLGNPVAIQGSPPHVNQARCASLLEDAYRDPSSSSVVVSPNASLVHDSSTLFHAAAPKGHGDKPFLILHIGPSKTGTTTLQKESVRLQDELQKDGFVYLGRYASRSLRQPAKIAELFSNDDCLKEVAVSLQQDSLTISSTSSVMPKSLPQCWKDRTQGIRDLYHAHNISIIISDEQFSYERQMISICNIDQAYYLPTLLKALGQDWNIMVVATYRRYAEWLLSVAKEVNQKVCHNPQRPEGQWNGPKCWSIWQLVNTYRSTRTGDAFSYMNLDTTVPAWRKHGIPVRMLNLYATEGQSFIASMYCDVIPSAPNACAEACRKATNQDDRPNPNTTHRENVQSVMTTVYNDIVYGAFQAGLLQQPLATNGTAVTRQDFVSSLARQGASMNLQMADLPLYCPRRSDLEVLLQKSLVMERVVLGPDTLRLEREKEHRRDFWRLADERKEFCSVNTQQLLRGKTSWKEVENFLRQLSGTRSFGLTK